MELYRHNGVFIAKTQYGEWQAKQVGFTWDAQTKTWRTTDEGRAKALATLAGLTILEYQMPSAQPPVDLWPNIPEGKFALMHPEERVLKFYQVDKPKEGKWAGYTFLKALASDTPWPIKEHAAKKAILDRIAADPLAAMARYGQHIGSCGNCGKTLTDDLSRQLGIGPICRKKLNYQGE